MNFLQILPPPVLGTVLDHCSVTEISILCLVDKYLNNYIHTCQIWKKLAKDNDLVLEKDTEVTNYKKIIIKCLWFVKKYNVNPRKFQLPITLDNESIYFDKSCSAIITSIRDGDFTTEISDPLRNSKNTFKTSKQFSMFIKVHTEMILVENIPVMDIVKAFIDENISDNVSDNVSLNTTADVPINTTSDVFITLNSTNPWRLYELPIEELPTFLSSCSNLFWSN
jgi:hypothetical protein